MTELTPLDMIEVQLDLWFLNSLRKANHEQSQMDKFLSNMEILTASAFEKNPNSKNPCSPPTPFSLDQPNISAPFSVDFQTFTSNRMKSFNNKLVQSAKSARSYLLSVSVCISMEEVKAISNSMGFNRSPRSVKKEFRVALKRLPPDKLDGADEILNRQPVAQKLQSEEEVKETCFLDEVDQEYRIISDLREPLETERTSARSYFDSDMREVSLPCTKAFVILPRVLYEFNMQQALAHFLQLIRTSHHPLSFDRLAQLDEKNGQNSSPSPDKAETEFIASNKLSLALECLGRMDLSPLKQGQIQGGLRVSTAFNPISAGNMPIKNP